LLTGREWLYPVLDTFLRGLPRTYRNIETADGTSISVQITGASGGEWTLVREGDQWRLFEGDDPQAACLVQIDQDLAWRMFTKGVDLEDARRRVRIVGNLELGIKVLELVAIMA
jgi:hypothetical protein